MRERPGISQLAPEYRGHAGGDAPKRVPPKHNNAAPVGLRGAIVIIGLASIVGGVGGFYLPAGYAAALQSIEILRGGMRTSPDCRPAVPRSVHLPITEMT